MIDNDKNGGELKQEELTIDSDKNQKSVGIDLDYVLINEVGQFGRFQLRTMILIAVVIVLASSGQEYIFSAAAIPHRCRIPECGEYSKLQEFEPEWIKNTVPETSSGLASCKRYAPLDVGSNGSLDYCPDTLFDQSRTVDCEAFVYAKDKTVVFEFDLGCQEWLRTLAGTLYNIGMLLTLPITGYISDHFGRKIALIANILTLCLFGFIRAFSTNYTMYLTLQIIQSTLGTGVFSSAYIIVMELVGPKHRVKTSVFTSIMFAIGEMFLGGVAWVTTSWRYMIMVTTIPGLLIISYYWLISESVRWLLSKKKYTEAKKILLTVARVNKTQISEKSLEALMITPQPSTTPEDNNSGLIRTILRSPVLLRRVCTTPIWWITMTFVYYGLAINSTGLSDTVYLNYILTAAIGVPGFYCAIFALERFGRKATLTSGFFISGACNICFIFISRDLTVPRLLIYLMGKFFIAAVGTSLYLYTLELYPTQYRHTLFGFSSMIGRLGSICAPLTPALMTYWHGIPSLLFGGMAIIAGLLALTQPETLGCKMPDTLAEAEVIGKSNS